jgi:hypothetical protein
LSGITSFNRALAEGPVLLAQLVRKNESDPSENEAHLIRKKTPAHPAAPTEVDILINQDFYLPGYPKVATIRSKGELKNAAFTITNKDSGKTVLNGPLKKYGTYSTWGDETFYFADFSKITEEGSYILAVETGGNRVSAPIDISSSDLSNAVADAAKYFFYQRCGFAVPGGHKACHLDDPQGTTGGWHDAGDYNKYIYTQWQPAWALLSLFEKTGESKYLEEALWGADFLAKMVRENGGMWSAVFDGSWAWTRPEDKVKRSLTPAQWGDATWAVAACSAAFARVAKNSSGAQREKFLALAKRTNEYFKAHYKFNNIVRGEDFQGLGGIVLSDLILYDLTGDASFLSSAEKSLKLILKHQDPRGFFFSDGNKREPFWDDYMTYFFVEAMGEYAKRFPNKPLTGEIKASLSKLMEGHIKKLAYNTPYRQMQWLDLFDSRPANGRRMENFYFKKINGYIRGSNSYYLSSANTAMISFSLLGREEYKDIAVNQLNWVLGVNPYRISFMEGHCTKCTKKYHHRYDTIPEHKNGAVFGGITNGIASTNGENYFYDALGSTWASNETWLPHNAWFIMLGLKLSAHDGNAYTLPILPVSADEPGNVSPPRRADEVQSQSAPVAKRKVEVISVARNNAKSDDPDSIGVDIKLRIPDIPEQTVSMRGIIITSQEWPQGECIFEKGKDVYTFKAYLYKYNKYSGFIVRGYDREGNTVFQTVSVPIKMPD